MCCRGLEADVVSHSSALSACEDGRKSRFVQTLRCSENPRALLRCRSIPWGLESRGAADWVCANVRRGFAGFRHWEASSTCGDVGLNAASSLTMQWPGPILRQGLNMYSSFIECQGNRCTCQWRALAARHGRNGQIAAAGKCSHGGHSQLRCQCLPAWSSVAGCPAPLQRPTCFQFALRPSNTQCSYSGMCSLWTMAEYHGPVARLAQCPVCNRQCGPCCGNRHMRDEPSAPKCSNASG